MAVMEEDLGLFPFTRNRFEIRGGHDELLGKIKDYSGYFYGGKVYALYDETD